ncbi:DUF4383 domain-containing protein [Catelliglobosispora koreensis]|uniref:DUF4383 domain-containing protein n=1 Tax=Catelliglobosispora koreensis TaxID=129052 RepID=UPI00037943ED|nr:DUF4383 domain-containing protein [Catelliglobosispora koreensis]
MAMHLPVNHPLRSLYRRLAFFAGLLMLVLGVVGFFATQGDPLFEASGATALGLRTNPAFSYASIGTGVLVTLATLLGRNVDRFAYLWIGVGHLIVGLAMMLLMNDPKTNYLNFTIVTCVVSFVIGSLLATAGMYVKVQRS